MEHSGRAFARICSSRAIAYKLLSRQDCDIAELISIEKAIELYKPWGIINAAGYVRVDDAEHDEDTCMRENVIGAHNLSMACKMHGIKLVTFSSDLVFDGQKTTPYVESDIKDPLNVYGRSKAISEDRVLNTNPDSLIIRTSAFFSPWDQYNFLHWIEESCNNESQVVVANDVYISPTYVPDLVNTTLDLLIDDEKGVWHLANDGAVTWADFAYITAERRNYDNSFIQAISSKEMDLAAQRPTYTVLGTEKGLLMPSLENALDRYFAEKKLEPVLV